MPILPLRIRDFRSHDFEALYAMDQVCFPPHIAFSRGEFVFCLNHPGSVVRVAERDGKIAGFVLARLETQSSAHVITLDVAPESRRYGIGTMLMNDLHHKLKRGKVGISILEVGVENAAAQRLYRKLGYQKEYTLIGYYRGREDAYRMELLLGSQ